MAGKNSNRYSTNEYIYTFAGDGKEGYGGDFGPATNAQLNPLWSLGIVTWNGAVYFADSGNNVIRRVSTDGIITTYAGNGRAGYSGDNGPAINAQLNLPSDLAVTNTLVLYIADSGNNVIRRISTDGIISTFAGNGTSGYSGDGGPAINAQLSGPSGIAVSLNGDVYVSDPINNVIRMIYVNGTISTYAGNGNVGYSGDNGPATSASLNWPNGISISPDNSLYIADKHNSVIRKVFVNGTIVTFAGNGNRGYSGDGGYATSASLHFPSSVAVSDTGEVYISDSGNSVIRKVITNGTIITVAGNGSFGYVGDGDIATNAELYYPTGLTVQPSTGNIYFIDSLNNVTRVLVTSPSSECSYHGTLQSQIYCICGSGYTGSTCQLITCFGINQTSISVCSQHGTCKSPNNCSCRNGYTGHNCQLSICFGFNETSSKVCSEHGTCISPNTCHCNTGYGGKLCNFETKKFMYLLFLLLVPLVAFIVIPIFLIVQKIWNRKGQSDLDQKLLSSELSENN